MKSTHINDLELQKKHWEQRKESLLIWLETHDYEHTNFIQNLNDLRHAECKVAQIESRIKRQGVSDIIAGAVTMATPIISTHYSF